MSARDPFASTIRVSRGPGIPQSKKGVGPLLLGLCLGWAALTQPGLAQEAGANSALPLPIAQLNRTALIDFEREILPIFQAKCLACHNQTRSKADLILETPQSILRGSDNGPVILPSRGAESLLLRAAAHQAKPFMPPRENKVGATDFTAKELALLKAWIDQGAKGEVKSPATIRWQPLPASYQPIYAVALTADGQLAACNRANQLFLYHLPSGRLLDSLIDPALTNTGSDRSAGIAHRDAIHSLAFSPDGTLLASGGYREIKLWQRPSLRRLFQWGPNSNEVSAMAISTDARWIATGDLTGRIRLHRAETGETIGMTEAHSLPVRVLSFSPDNRRLLSSADDQWIRLWDHPGGTRYAEVKIPGDVSAVCWLQDSRHFVTGSEDGVVRLFAAPPEPDLPIVSVRKISVLPSAVTALETVTQTQERLLAGAADGTIRLWDLEHNTLLHELNQTNPVASLAVSPDGTRLATTSSDAFARLWDLGTGKLIAAMTGNRLAREEVADRERAWRLATNEVAYRGTVATNAEKERVNQLDRVRKATESLNAAEKSLSERQQKVQAAATGKSNAERASAEVAAELAKSKSAFEAMENAAQQARFELQACLNSLETNSAPPHTPSSAPESKPRSEPPAETLAELAERLFVQAQAAGQAKAQFDRTTADLQARQKQTGDEVVAATKRLEEAETELKKAGQTKSNGENELTLAIAAAQRAADAALEASNAIPLAEAESKKCRTELQAAQRTWEESQKPFRAIAFSPSNDVLATASDDRRIYTWSALNGRAFDVISDDVPSADKIAFGGSHRLLTVSTNGSVTGWNLNPNWTLKQILGVGERGAEVADRVNALAFSPDGKTLACGSGEPSRSGQIQLWQIANGQLARQFDQVHSDAVFALEYSPNGRYLASGSADRFMKILDLDTGKILKAFEGHTHHVLGVAWTRDGRTLASAGADNVVKLWDLKTGERKKNVEGFAKEVTAIRGFRGEEFIAISGDHQVQVINAKGEKLRTFSDANDFLYSAGATPDGGWVIVGGQDSVLRVWNGESGALVTSLHPPSGEVAHLSK